MSETTKHTPAPWIIDNNEAFKNRYFHKFYIINEASNTCIVKLQYTDKTSQLDKEKIAANAKLIAAAPEMLEALQYAVSWLEESKVHKTIVENLNKVIKKATGNL